MKRPRVGGAAIPGNIGLFARGTLSDITVRRALAAGMTPAQAFDHLYTKDPDPWRSASPAYRYQDRKHRRMLALLPGRRFARALDLGCGPGLFTRLLASRSDRVLGVDVSAVALAAARRHCAGLPGVTFGEGDITADGPWMEQAAFDLIVLADTVYYLPAPIADATLKDVAQRAARLLVPGGLLLLVNQYFTRWDPDSRFSARIETAFAWSAAFEPVARRRHNFWLGTVLERAAS